MEIKKRRRQFFFQLIGPRKTVVKKKATAYAKAVHVIIRIHTEAQGLSSLTVNEFPRFISEKDKHSCVYRIMLQCYEIISFVQHWNDIFLR